MNELERIDRRLRALDRREDRVTFGAGLALSVLYGLVLWLAGYDPGYTLLIPFALGFGATKLALAAWGAYLERKRDAAAAALPVARVVAIAAPREEPLPSDDPKLLR